ncbi:MAG: carbamoyl-phosphate synthase large subunit [Lachnospiraceae bacterium]|nr:carbamoyl-phosphate synthase large subunit [Lachnospiraceae bacterium]
MKREDIHSILIIGSGPIIIGQACEFDYSGTQACKALRQLGYRIILVNSNPATIMTDPEMADVTYIEPLNVERLTEIIEKERPDALLPNLGGQSGLNLSSELAKAGVLDKYGVKVIGVQLDAIERGEDRIEFKKTMDSLGIEMARSQVAYSVEEAVAIADDIGYPVVLRPAYTMGGSGGGLVYNVDEMKVVCERGLQASLVHQVLVEESVIGWEELELEVVRDQKGQMVTVCFIENIDPMGVHTGDSLCAAPMLTIPQEVQDRLQEQAWKVVDKVQVIGGCNCQFAHDPKTGRIIIIEINPRTSRSSALASKATGFPIALISAMLACGMTLDEIPCGKYGTLDKYVPDGDYIVIKAARWAFEKFHGVSDHLGTQMRAVGEVMSIGKTYKEALQKAVRSLEKGRWGLGHVNGYHEKSLDDLLSMLIYPTSERQFILYEALRKGASVEKLHEMTKIKTWFLEQMKELVDEEEAVTAAANASSGGRIPDELLIQAKKDGFSDRYLSEITGIAEETIRARREELGVTEKWEGIHVSGTQDAAYYYSSYNLEEDKDPVDGSKPKVMILGGGPNRIGQGIEFDYCCVHAAYALRDMGFGTVIVNCNPETVSTDYDTSDKLYFEPLTLEDVLAIYNKEKPVGVIAQFGGQTPLNLAADLKKYGVNILGTTPETIDMAEDRDLFRAMMEKLNIPMPEAGMAVTVEEAKEIAGRIGYPVMVRPSFVLGGRGMEVVHDDEQMEGYMKAAIGVTPDRPILIDRFLHHATECEADAISDGEHVFVPAVMEHIELAGIHSGDSACILPSRHLTDEQVQTIRSYTQKIASEMHVVGLMNMQYAIENGKVYVIEANPRASRTVPLVSKVCDINMVRIATDIMTGHITGRPSPVPGLKEKKIPYYGVKEAVFPFNMFQEVDPVLGPEMRSTGEVLGLSEHWGRAFYLAQEATQTRLPMSGTVLISVSDSDKEDLVEVATHFSDSGFRILATEGTWKMITDAGIKAEKILKNYEGRPNILDAIVNGKIDLIINTPVGKKDAIDDSYIRKNAIRHHIPYITTMAAALATASGIRSEKRAEAPGITSLQEFHKRIQ